MEEEWLNEDMDALGVPCRWVDAPPAGFVPYHRQKPGVMYVEMHYPTGI